MNHHYELTLLPTAAQATVLDHLMAPQRQLAWKPDPGCALTGTAPQACPALFPGRLPGQLALTGPGLVRPVGPGLVKVTGVPGAVAAATDDPAVLPRWAREVLGREYLPAQQETLVRQVPALSRAWRMDWADIRREPYGWVLELEFVWDAFAPWGLTWFELRERPHDPLLRQLMV